MRITSLVLLTSCFTLACSTAEQNTESATLSAGSASAGSSTGEPATGGNQTDPGTTHPGSGTEGTTGSATTGPGTTATGTSGTQTTSETGPMTGTTGMSTDSGTDTDTTTGTSTTTGTGTDTDTTTGGMSGGACQVDADCKLHDDCCSCYAIPVDQNDGECEKDCEQSKCSEIGIDKAVCRFGQCTLEKVDCSSPVACDSLPPECPPGSLPGIEGACWSGFCVPAEACDKVPDCALCPDSMMCVEFQAWVNDKTCEPIPADCNGDANCKCAGEAACVDPFGICNEGQGEVDLACLCPAC